MDRFPAKQNLRAINSHQHRLSPMCSLLLLILSTGCYAPLHSPGVEARTLPDEYRWPMRTSETPLNYSRLVGQANDVYLLGPGDIIKITAPDLIAQGHAEPFEVQVLDHGEVYLPRLGPVAVGGLSIAQAQHQVNQALANNLLINPCTVITLKEKGTVNVLVLGAVKQQGMHALPRDANDVAHALAAAQGFSEDAGEVIEIHRHGKNLQLPMLDGANRSNLPLQYPVNSAPISSTGSKPWELQHSSGQPFSSVPANLQAAHSLPPSTTVPAPQPAGRRMPPHGLPVGGHSLTTLTRDRIPSEIPCEVVSQAESIVRIPLRGENGITKPYDVILNSGDVIVIPSRTDKVFFVVGPLSDRNSLRFSVNDRDREIGSGLLLPDDREIDVVTAVAMAGYIDPIESPTTVTVHRVLPDRSPLLIRVDLIAARSDPQENVMVQAGDIIYLNPDGWWYTR